MSLIAELESPDLSEIAITPNLHRQAAADDL